MPAAPTMSHTPSREHRFRHIEAVHPPAPTIGVSKPAARTAARIAAVGSALRPNGPALVRNETAACIRNRSGLCTGKPPRRRFGCLASSNFPPRDSERKSMPARANALAKYAASVEVAAAGDAFVGQESAAHDIVCADARAHRCETLRAANARGSRAGRRSRRRACWCARGTTPSCRRARNAARRRQSPLRARARPRPRTSRAGPLGDRGCAADACRSLARGSRTRSASRSRAVRTSLQFGRSA